VACYERQRSAEGMFVKVSNAWNIVSRSVKQHWRESIGRAMEGKGVQGNVCESEKWLEYKQCWN